MVPLFVYTNNKFSLLCEMKYFMLFRRRLHYNVYCLRIKSCPYNE